MRNTSLLPALLFFLQPLHSQVTINGKITLSPAWESKLYLGGLDRFDLRTTLLDSIELDPEGNFSYRLNRPDPKRVIYRVLIPPSNGNHLSIVEGFADNYIFLTLQPGDSCYITGSSDSLYYTYRVFHSELNKNLMSYRDYRKPFYYTAQVMSKRMRQYPDSIAQIRENSMPIWMNEVERFKEKVKKHLDGSTEASDQLMGLYYLFLAGFGSIDSLYASTILNQNKLDNYYLTEDLHHFLQSAENNRVGKMVPQVKMLDKDGKNISLFEQAKDTTVLDFWASWCGPCRLANKGHLKEIYPHLRKRKIALISVSMDEDPEKWKKAVKEDGIAWPAYLEQKDQRIASKLLGIYGLPVYLVLDKNHKVIFHSSSSYALMQFLKLAE